MELVETSFSWVLRGVFSVVHVSESECLKCLSENLFSNKLLKKPSLINGEKTYVRGPFSFSASIIVFKAEYGDS